jgi:hypothetical protein
LIEYPPVPDKIEAAEGAISTRLSEKPTDAEEILALRDALFALEIVFPEINKGVGFCMGATFYPASTA